MEHLRQYFARMNIPRVIRECERYENWSALCFLYVQVRSLLLYLLPLLLLLPLPASSTPSASSTCFLYAFCFL